MSSFKFLLRGQYNPSKTFAMSEGFSFRQGRDDLLVTVEGNNNRVYNGIGKLKRLHLGVPPLSVGATISEESLPFGFSRLQLGRANIMMSTNNSDVIF